MEKTPDLHFLFKQNKSVCSWDLRCLLPSGGPARGDRPAALAEVARGVGDASLDVTCLAALRFVACSTAVERFLDGVWRFFVGVGRVLWMFDLGVYCVLIFLSGWFQEPRLSFRFFCWSCPPLLPSLAFFVLLVWFVYVRNAQTDGLLVV